MFSTRGMGSRFNLFTGGYEVKVTATNEHYHENAAGPKRETADFFCPITSRKSTAWSADAVEIREPRLSRAPIHTAVMVQITQAVVTRQKFAIDIQNILAFKM